MLPSPIEVSNSAEDQAVRMVAPALEIDDEIHPAKFLPGRIDGVSFVRRSSRRLLPSMLRASVRTNGMASNTYERSGYIFT